jgi:hypothetical protein
MRENIYACRVLVGNPEEMKHLGYLVKDGEDNNMLDCKENSIAQETRRT